jgi:hypothetical protein
MASDNLLLDASTCRGGALRGANAGSRARAPGPWHGGTAGGAQAAPAPHGGPARRTQRRRGRRAVSRPDEAVAVRGRVTLRITVLLSGRKSHEMTRRRGSGPCATAPRSGIEPPRRPAGPVRLRPWACAARPPRPPLARRLAATLARHTAAPARCDDGSERPAPGQPAALLDRVSPQESTTCLSYSPRRRQVLRKSGRSAGAADGATGQIYSPETN